MSERPSEPRHEVRLLHDRRVPTRDGITLSAETLTGTVFTSSASFCTVTITVGRVTVGGFDWAKDAVGRARANRTAKRIVDI